MWEFFKEGGPVMILLIMTSLMALTFMIERGRALRKINIIPDELRDAMGEIRNDQDLQKLQKRCEKVPSALSRLILVAIEHLDLPRAENADAVQSKARQEINNMERGLVVLEVTVGIAPLLGLVGAVHGLIIMFKDFGAIADNSSLAQGIAIALHTTLVGLLIAIPALIAWSFYNKKVESMAVELETLMEAFLRKCYHNS